MTKRKFSHKLILKSILFKKAHDCKPNFHILHNKIFNITNRQSAFFQLPIADVLPILESLSIGAEISQNKNVNPFVGFAQFERASHSCAVIRQFRTCEKIRDGIRKNSHPSTCVWWMSNVVGFYMVCGCTIIGDVKVNHVRSVGRFCEMLLWEMYE